MMSQYPNCVGMEPMLSEEVPEFERILNDLYSLVHKLRNVRETSVAISDALIGVQNTGEMGDDSAKHTTPYYFVIRCFDAIHDLGEEVERLEHINTRLLHSMDVM